MVVSHGMLMHRGSEWFVRQPRPREAEGTASDGTCCCLSSRLSLNTEAALWIAETRAAARWARSSTRPGGRLRSRPRFVLSAAPLVHVVNLIVTSELLLLPKLLFMITPCACLYLPVPPLIGTLGGAFCPTFRVTSVASSIDPPIAI